MLKGAVARRYAQALFDVGEEKGLLEVFQEDLSDVVRVLTHPDVAQAMDSPKMTASTKRALMRRFLGERNPYTLNFLDLLVSKNRTSFIREIRESFRGLFNAHEGIAIAQVTTAVALAEDEQKKLSERLAEITGRKVILEPKVNESILGGLVVRIGDRVIDGSTITKLKALRAELAGAA
ncbi:MAG: F0F1 ATP synthase subunit delta [Dehalococcoidia bacterium]|nr:F0F1 ATP synthase subunit delta [Dehalococcoidia bacterium]